VSISGTPYVHEISDYVVAKKIKVTLLVKTYNVDKLDVFVVSISTNNAQCVFFYFNNIYILIIRTRFDTFVPFSVGSKVVLC